MSRVTGIVLICGSAERQGSKGEDGPPLPLEEINAWLDQHGLDPLCLIDQHCKGAKHPEICIAGGGMNYFGSADAFARFVLARDWNEPERVVLTMTPPQAAAIVLRPQIGASWSTSPPARASEVGEPCTFMGRPVLDCCDPEDLARYRRGEPLAGKISVGQVFIWEPDLPHAQNIATVTEILSDRVGSYDKTARICWNENARFREAVVRLAS